MAEFAAHNIEHLAAQKAKLKSFFDTVVASPLTDEQTDACICMDNAVQIVAAAGSGKTSTMVAKTGYVLHERLAKPEQILLLAFNTEAAEELRERIRDRLNGFEGLENVDCLDLPRVRLQWDLFRTVYGRAIDRPEDMVQPHDDGA